eukprot:scaffold99315_cov24-Tisochrysis_lutea.AAC.2
MHSCSGYAQLWRETYPQPQLLQHAQAQGSAAPAASRAATLGVAYPGCTALAALVVEGTLVVANAGLGVDMGVGADMGVDVGGCIQKTFDSVT